MLLELEIENLALLRNARAAFVRDGRTTSALATGYAAITGETGTGKTLVLRALALLRGERGDKTQVRDGAEEARVSGLFQIPPALRGEIAAAIAPLEIEDGDRLLLTRTVARDGRGRCFANGRLIAQGVLKAVGRRLIDVVSQGAADLLHETAHRALLIDAFGSLQAERDRYLAARQRALDSRDRRDRLVRERQQRRQRLDYLRFQKREIDSVAVRPGEAAELARELSILEAADELRQLCSEAVARLYEDDDALLSAVDRFVRRAESLTDGARDLLAGATGALARASVEITEAAGQFRTALDRVAFEPEHLARVTDRLDRIRRLLDRFGPTEDRLIAAHEGAVLEIQALERDEEGCLSADSEFDAAKRELVDASAKLDQARTIAGRKLARAVEKELKRLGMPQARFTMVLAATADDAIERAEESGPSRVRFLLAANDGLAARPLEDVASGGESARIALALHAVLSAVRDVPCLVFDEIESGIGSRLGEVVAACLEDIAKRRQVIVVTHLPAVAARAGVHLRIAKRSAAGATESSIDPLSGAAREHEIAAMLRGEPAAERTRAAARELLAGEEHAK